MSEPEAVIRLRQYVKSSQGWYPERTLNEREILDYIDELVQEITKLRRAETPPSKDDCGG